MSPRAWRAAVLSVLVVVFVAHAVHRRFLIDDAYISFRYARNLVEGTGLVYNPGERVEGYSNLLWVLLLAAGMRAGIAPELGACVLGVLSGIGVLLVTWRAAGRALAGDRLAPWLALVPVAALSLNRSEAAWATGGLETRTFTFLLLLGALLLDVESRGGRGRFPWSAVPLGLALLTRADGFVLVAAAVATFLAVRGGRPGRYGTMLVGLLAATLLAQAAFRWGYYGDLIPNSVRAKATGVGLGAGLRYVSVAATGYGLWVGIPLSLLSLGRPSRTAAFVWIGAACLVTQLGFVALVGGDHFELRFLDAVWPIAAVLAVAGARRLPVAAGTALLAVFLAWNLMPLATGYRDTRETFSVETESAKCALWAQIGRYFRAAADPHEVLALRPAGVIPYLSRLRALDMHGLNDRIVARRPPQPGVTVAGHQRLAGWDDLLRARTTYLIDHPLVRLEPPSAADPPTVVEVGGGRRVALFPVWIRLEGFWFRFLVVSEEAVTARGLDPSRIRARIRP